MFDFSVLLNVLFVSLFCSIFTSFFIQKTKKYCPSGDVIIIYSLIVNLLFGISFAYTFTNFCFLEIIWVGLSSFLISDTFYQLLDGKIFSYSDLVAEKS